MSLPAKREFKDALFGEFSRIGKALASGRRLELIELLAQGGRTVEQLATESSLSVANASQHLQVLREARLVETARRGTFIEYRLADDRVLQLWMALRETGAARLAEVDSLVNGYLGDRRQLQAIDCAELRRRMAAGGALVIDVRPMLEYEAGHISGARSVPVEEIEARMKELPKSKTVVAYCRGPYCVFADEAVALLTRRGFRAMRLDAGLPDWKLDGGAIEYGASKN
jgi:rhodanese-related sulfurtransferase/DNA-binding transcriptional ArsR family regulator